MPVVEEISHIIILSRLKPEMVDELLPYIDELHYDEEETIFSEKDEADRFFMLNKGKVLLQKRIDPHITISLSAIKPGYSFGWNALLRNAEYTTDAKCAEPSSVFSIRAAKLQRLMDKDNTLGYLFLQRMLFILKGRLIQRTEQFVRALKTHPDILSLIE